MLYAPVPGQTGSGAYDSQNVCYDTMNRLIWAGNSRTQLAAGNGTCGEATLETSIPGAEYASAYGSTNLGQIWQGQLNYCDQNRPHHLSGVYPLGTTCAARKSNTTVYEASSSRLGDRLIGKTDGMTTQFFLTEVLDSVISTFNNVAGSAVILGNQLSVPSGNTRYQKGRWEHRKGYTGQYEDEIGLKYDHARYDDPVVGRFVSADTVEGNAQGFDPYEYAGNSPVTFSDPTGQYISTTVGQGEWIVHHCGKSVDQLLSDAGKMLSNKKYIKIC